MRVLLKVNATYNSRLVVVGSHYHRRIISVRRHASHACLVLGIGHTIVDTNIAVVEPSAGWLKAIEIAVSYNVGQVTSIRL